VHAAGCSRGAAPPPGKRAPPAAALRLLPRARPARDCADDRSLDAIFEIGRGNLRATDDLAFNSLDYAAAGGHAAVSVQHVVAVRKDLWP
jgi:hypothetical protein